MHPKPNSSSRFANSKNRIEIIQKEILKTLCYSDLFDYPLTGDQIFQYLGISAKGKDFLTTLKTIPYVISGKTIYYHLPRRQKLVDGRLQKEKWNNKKIEKAIKIVGLLRLIPTIRFIGISGSVALKNAEKHADIDLFFICASNTVWLTRFFVYVFLHLLGVRRKRNKKTSESICANMFVDELSLKFQKPKQNIYIAHEIIQMLPLYDKKDFFSKLSSANIWIKNFFPNINFPKRGKKQKNISLWYLLFPVEYFMLLLQKWYMEKHQTREITTRHVIAFHPIDYEAITLTRYNKKCLL